MYEWLLDYWYYLAIPFVLYFFATPFMIMGTLKLKARPDLEELDLHAIDRTTARYIAEKSSQLAELGFVDPLLFRMPEVVAGVDPYLAILVHPATGDKALVSVIKAANELVSIKQSQVEFNTHFSDGRDFDTSNTTDPGAFVKEPTNVSHHLSSVKDVKKLFALHRFILKKHGAGGKGMLPADMTSHILNEVLKQPYELQKKHGLLKYHEKYGEYRPTILGAFRYAWAELQPIKWFRKLARQSKERKLLREFEEQNANDCRVA